MKLVAEQLAYAVHDVAILDDINLVLDDGRIVVLLGPNGAGKSTLLRLLSGRLEPDRGSIELDGRKLSAYRVAERARLLAVLTQRNQLEFPFTARQVIGMGRTPYGYSAGDDAVSNELIELLGIDADRIYTSLSGGERQIVQLARVLAQVWGRGARALLLLDEPMSALDLRHQAMLSRLLIEIRQTGLGQLIVMHDINLAAELADDIVLMNRGRLIAAGPVEQTLNVANLEATFETGINVLGEPGEQFFKAAPG